MQPGYYKAKNILIMGIIAIVLLIIAIGLFVGSAISVVNAVNNFSQLSIISSSTLMIFGWLLIVVYGILSLVIGIMILVTDFKNAEVNESRIVWGILSIILAGGLFGIIFGATAMNKFNAIKSSHYSTPSTNPPPSTDTPSADTPSIVSSI